MKCAACGRQITDGSTFCPYCGGRADQAPAESDKTAAFDSRELARMLDAEDDNDATVSMNAHELGLAEALAAHAAEMAAKSKQVAAEPLPDEDFDDGGATVAMVLPPGFAESLDALDAAESSPKTILGRPGAVAPVSARGGERGGDIDPFGHTLQSPAITDEELKALTPDVSAMMGGSAAHRSPDMALGGAALSAVASGPVTQVAPGAKKGGAAIKVVLVLVLVALLAAAVYFVLSLRGGAGGSSGALAQATMPKDVDAVLGVSWDAIRSTWVWDKAGPALNKQLADDGVGKKMAELGVSVDSLRAIAVGMKSSSDGSPASVVAAEGSFDREKVSAELAKLNGGEKLTVGGADFYGKPTRMITGIVADDLVMSGAKDLVELAMAARASGETVANNEAVQAALGSVDGGAPLWGAAVVNAQALGMAEEAGGGVVTQYVAAGDSFGFSLDLTADVIFRAGGVFSDEERAGKARLALEQGVTLLKTMAQLAGKEAIPDAYREDVPKLLDSIKVEQDGQVVRLTVQVPKDLAGRALDDAMKQYRGSAPAPGE